MYKITPNVKKKTKKVSVLILVVEYKRDYDSTKNIEELYVNIAEVGAVFIAEECAVIIEK